MQKKTKKAIADTAITLVILTVTFFISMLLQNVLEYPNKPNAQL